MRQPAEDEESDCTATLATELQEYNPWGDVHASVPFCPSRGNVTAESALKVHKRAHYWARKHGYEHLADDFASDAVLQHWRFGRRRIDWIFADWAGREFGYNKDPGTKHRQWVDKHMQRIVDAEEDEADHATQVGVMPEVPEADYFQSVIDECGFKGEDAELFVLFYVQGFTQREAMIAMDRSRSFVQIRLKQIHDKLLLRHDRKGAEFWPKALSRYFAAIKRGKKWKRSSR